MQLNASPAGRAAIGLAKRRGRPAETMIQPPVALWDCLWCGHAEQLRDADNGSRRRRATWFWVQCAGCGAQGPTVADLVARCMTPAQARQLCQAAARNRWNQRT